MAQIQNWPRNPELRADPTKVKGRPCTAAILGFAYTEEFKDSSNRFWFEFHRGQSLIAPVSLGDCSHFTSADSLRRHVEDLRRQGLLKEMNVRLDAPINYGWPIRWLRNEPADWGELIARIRDGAVPIPGGNGEEHQAMTF